MAVLQRNTNGVLSRGSNGVILRAASSDLCCCEGAGVVPARKCSDDSLYVYSGHAFRAPGEAVFACGVAGTVWHPNAYNGFSYAGIGECVYFDAADCRPSDVTDHLLFGGTEYDSCEDCESVLP